MSIDKIKLIGKFLNELGTTKSTEIEIESVLRSEESIIDTEHDQTIRVIVSETKHKVNETKYTFEIQRIGEENQRDRFFQKSTLVPLAEIEIQIEHRLNQIHNILQEMDILHVAANNIQNFIDKG